MLVENATRVTAALGSLKGVPMKLGQMLSLHQGLLPPEVANVLRCLQQQAPAIDFAQIEVELKRELGCGFQAVREIDPEPYASASIGQMHRAELQDGRHVVFKVQYPGIHEVIESDMKNLKGVIQFTFSLFSRTDTEPVWAEVRDRLEEEIDYFREAEHIRRMRRYWKDEPRIRIPSVIDELSTRHVLCMERVEGITPDEACGEDMPAELRDQWGQMLFRFVVEGLFRHRFLHADPNLANFSFREDGGVNVYDFGCVKHIPAPLARGYADLTRAVLDSEYRALPAILDRMGVRHADDGRVAADWVTEIGKVIRVPFRKRPPYRFGVSGSLYPELLDLGSRHWAQFADVTFPPDVMFIHRTFLGHFGNLERLRARAPWHDLLAGATLAA